VRRLVVGLAACAALSFPRRAFAYDTNTHFRIAQFAWQTMRLAADEKQRQHVPWKTAPSNDDFLYPDVLGKCDIGDHCRGTSEDEYRAFLKDVGASMRRLNRFMPAVPDATKKPLLAKAHDILPAVWGSPVPCQSPATATVQDFAWHIGSHYRPAIRAAGKVRLDGSCTTGDFAWSGLYRSGVDPLHGALPDDGMGLQGTVFGYLAQQPDNLWGDTILFQAPLYGAYLTNMAALPELALGLAFAAIYCFAQPILSFFGADSDSCFDDGFDAGNRGIMQKLVRSVLPGWDREPAADLVGVWHFIRPGHHGAFNDVPGLDYGEAGPGGAGPGALDTAIRLGSRLLELRLDADASDGDDHYRIRTNEDGQRRADSADYSTTLVADTEFEPVDNLAQYGWAEFQKSVQAGKWNTEGLAYPLHALGDVTVPMHVVGTTGYGHRPYEEWVDNHVRELLLDACKDDDATAAMPCTDEFLRAQIAQSRRILQWARYFRDTTNTDVGVRRLVTKVAEQTLAMVGDTKESWPFCDECSTAWQLANDDTSTLEKIGLGATAASKLALYTHLDSNYYGQYREKIRPLLEMSVGASVALLMKASEGRCTDIGAACGVDADCCTGSCSDGTCRRPSADACADAAECATGQKCGPQGLCCAPDPGSPCDENADCCSGLCDGGTCRKAPLGGVCETTADCGAGICIEGVCATKEMGLPPLE
jgi:hypothetical protein